MGKDAAEIGGNFTPAWARWLGNWPRNFTPTAFPQMPSSRSWKPSTLGDEMARQLIEINVQEQADDWPLDQRGECPVCGGAARKAPDDPRVLTTTRGDVAWKERVVHCPRCRRAFFPSGSSVGP